MNISLSDILFVLVIFQMLFLSFFLFTQQKGKRISNTLLGCFFLSGSLNLLDVFLLMTGAYSANPYLAGWGSCLPLLFGPFIYFYTKSVLDKDFSFTFKNWKHFVPFVVFFLGTEFYFIIQPKNVQRSILSNVLSHQFSGIVSFVSALIFVQFLFYIIASLRLISLYKKTAAQHLSNRRQIDISWLSSTVIFFLVLIVLIILNGLVTQTSLATYYLVGFNIIILTMFGFIITVLLKALHKPYFFSFSDSGGDSSTEQAIIAPKSGLTETETREKEKEIQVVLNYMQNSKPYLEPELTLEQLASQLSMKPRVLSQMINEILGQNFFDFINRYRIDEASLLLTNPKDKKITILEVLYGVGFNSKSSFNTLFKKYTGLTPTEYRKKQAG